MFKSILIVLLLAQSALFAQNSLSILGTVKDKSSNTVMEYATVSLYSAADSSLVTGLVTDLEGKFKLEKLKPGAYYVEFSFIGFTPKVINGISLSKATSPLNLGTVELGSDATMVNEVEVTALKSSVRYELDKKVVDVDKNIAAASGTAAEVLQTVPSIQTDVDGNIKLRGSSSFKVFINGRPSVLDANDALQQIPASTIENIEIITNPSAKYDAEGTGGIINIITKKQRFEGFSGIVNLRGGIWDTYGGDATLSVKKDRFTFTLSGNYDNFGRPSNYSSELNTTINDTTVSTINDGRKKRSFARYNINAGLEYEINDNNYIGASYRHGGFKMRTDDELDFAFINRTTGEEERFTNFNESYRHGPYHEFAINYGATFKNKHKLTAAANYNFRNFTERIENERRDGDEVILGTRSQEIGPSNRLRINVDYVAPINDVSKFEFGFLQELNSSDDENIAFNQDLATSQFIEDPQFYSDVEFSRNIRSFYGTFSSKWKKLSYQFGIRSENTNREIAVRNTTESFKVKRLDLFPSAFFSYQLNDKHQFFANYSKRINRPRSWYLEPNVIFTDANTLWGGNPNILPEYIHSAELGWLYKFGKKGTWSNEFYFKNQQNVIQIVRIPVGFELTQQLPENVGISNEAGLESSLSILAFKWWNTDLMANLFYYNLQGQFQNEIFDRSAFSYTFRWNNYFSIKKNTKIQFNTTYESPIVRAQGKQSYTLRFDAGIRQQFLDKKLSIGVQVRDLFNTYERRNVNTGANFDLVSINNPRSPSVVFSASYKINNFRAQRPNFSGGGGEF